jgi:hypothetical protein
MVLLQGMPWACRKLIGAPDDADGSELPQPESAAREPAQPGSKRGGESYGAGAIPQPAASGARHFQEQRSARCAPTGEE